MPTGPTDRPFGPGQVIPQPTTTSSNSPAVQAAVQAIFAADPSQQQVFQNQFGGDMNAWLASFTQWWSNYGSQVQNNLQNFQPEVNLLGALGYQQGQGGNWVAGPNAQVQAPGLGSNTPGSGPAAAPGTPGSGSTSTPAEQGLYDEVIGGLNNEVLNDQNLATDTTNLQNQAITNFDSLGNVLSQAVAPAGGLSAVTTQEDQGIQQSAATQLQALSSSIAAMQGSLTGTLAAQASALQQSIQQQLANISTYGDQATTALANQISTQVGDLQNSIGAQKQALTTQIQALSGAADTSSQAQLAVLQNQLQQLTSAEAPVAAARNAAAQAQVTAVNVGEAQAKNQIQGQQQLQGFIGGSSELDNALVQAGISAQQQGAAAVGDANLTNAQELAAIQSGGANTQANIGNTLATQDQAIADQGATGQGALDTALASGTQGLLDTGAAGKASIANTVAGQTEGTANAGAQTGYTNTATGLAEQNQLNDVLAGEGANIQDTAAQQTQTNLQNQYGQSLQAALAGASLPGQEAQTIAGIDPLQNTGLIDAQNALNWWISNTPPPSPTTTTSTAPTTGNTIAGAGAGLLGAATAIGNSQGWWQQPTTQPITPAQNAAATQPFSASTLTPINTSITG